MRLFKAGLFFLIIVGLLFLTPKGAAAATISKVSLSLARFKEVLDKNLDISISRINKNYVDYIGVFENKIPLKISSFVSVEAASTQFLKEYGRHFGISNYKTDLKFSLKNRDGFGQNYLFYTQYYKDIPVYGGEFIVQVDDTDEIYAGLSKFIPNISLNVKPTIKEAKVIALAKAVGTKDKMKVPDIKSKQLVIFNPRLFDLGVKDKNYLAWNIVLTDGNNWRERIFIDAKTGKTLQKWPLVKNAGIGKMHLYDWLDANRTRSIIGDDTISRKVYDCRPDGCMQESTPGNPRFTDSVNMRNEGQPPIGDPDVDNIYTNLGHAFNYFKETFDYWGANGMGGMGSSDSNRWPLLQSTVYSHFIATSTWGTCPNCWGGADALEFCDETVNLTTVGHEYTHAVSDFNKRASNGFDYINESGAIEEAYADIFSQAIERYATGGSSWKIGAADAAGVFTTWRNMIDPTNAVRAVSGLNCPCPERHYGPQFYCGGNWDLGGVHRNSTVISHMAYILSIGGIINGCAVEAIGQEKVEQIFYHAFRHNLPQAPNFRDLYTGLLRSCGVLFKWETGECKNLVLAMQGAELDQEKACHAAADAPMCKYLAFDIRGSSLFGLKRFNLNMQPMEMKINKGADLENVLPKLESPSVIDSLQTPALTPAPAAVDTGNNTSQTTAPTTSVVEEEVRTPNFTVDVIQNGKNVTINGVLNYYGKGAKCSGPRYFDPIIVRWGQGDSHPTLNSNNTFTASHVYDVKNKTYGLSVSVINSCFGSYTFRKTLTFPL